MAVKDVQMYEVKICGLYTSDLLRQTAMVTVEECCP
jgi:hypothetical protein